MPTDSPQVSRTLSGFSETMSDDEFVAYLKKEGLKEKDCSKLIGMHDYGFTMFSLVMV